MLCDPDKTCFAYGIVATKCMLYMTGPHSGDATAAHKCFAKDKILECDDGKKAINSDIAPCADGSKPACSDKAAPLCADGKEPTRSKDMKSPAMCADKSRPACSDKKPMLCADGKEPSKKMARGGKMAFGGRGSKCATGLCCGDATGKTDSTKTIKGVCNTDTLTTYKKGDVEYNFVCVEGAKSLLTSATAALAAAYLMA